MWSNRSLSPSPTLPPEAGGLGKVSPRRSTKSARRSAGHPSSKQSTSPSIALGFLPIPAGVPPEITNTVFCWLTARPEYKVKSTCISTFKRPVGVPGTIAVPPAAGARFGPFPCTNIRKLLTPGVSVNPACAASAIPLATGKIPPTLVVTDPVAIPEQTSNKPEQSAKLMIIEGVPVAPNALGAGNNPSVNCSKLTSPDTNDRDTAAYSTLHPPFLIATISPNSVDGPL